MRTILKHLEPRRRTRQDQCVVVDSESASNISGGRRVANGLGQYALRSRRGVFICTLVIMLVLSVDAAAVGEFDSSTEQAASPDTAESRAEAPSQWNLQMERKWTAGYSMPYQSLNAKDVMTKLPSGAITPALVETHDPRKNSHEILRSYVSAIERPPAAAHIASARKSEDPAPDVIWEAATPSVSEVRLDAPMDLARAVPTTAVEHHEAVTSKSVETSEIVLQRHPEILVAQTVWHPRAERRLALVRISGRAPIKLQEGDQLDLLEVDTIEPSGVAFRYDGVEIRIRVGGVTRKMDPPSDASLPWGFQDVQK